MTKRLGNIATLNIAVKKVLNVHTSYSTLIVLIHHAITMSLAAHGTIVERDSGAHLVGAVNKLVIHFVEINLLVLLLIFLKQLRVDD